MSVINPLSLEILTNIFRTSNKDSKRIVNREGTTIEFKESYNHGGMAQYFKAIAAFANNNGGYILFGVGDSPRRLIGLREKSLKQFEELKVEEFTKNLLEYFSPEIKWEHCTFEFRDMSFGVIYVHPLKRKPCVCKKNHDDNNPKYSLKEGDIYYRYGGRSERIKYEELISIIDDARKKEEQEWIKFAKKAARIGVSNAALLDLNTGNLTGSNGTVIIDEDLLNKIAFIKEGEFVEKGGTPTLRVIGEVRKIGAGKIIQTNTTKKVKRAIEPSDIMISFLKKQTIDEPLEYIKRICSESSGYYPVYYYIHKAQLAVSDIIKIVENTKSRGVGKTKLLERLNGKYIGVLNTPVPKIEISKQKIEYKRCWLNENISENIEKIGYCIDALFYLTDEEIYLHQNYIKNKMLDIYEVYFETVDSVIASNIRKAICRIDEALYLNMGII